MQKKTCQRYFFEQIFSKAKKSKWLLKYTRNLFVIVSEEYEFFQEQKEQIAHEVKKKLVITFALF